jgi:hypothetical protein
MQKPILKFNHFSGLFEEDESSGNSAQIKAIDIIINTFFEMYGMIVTRIGGYREGVKDYQAIANSENEKRGELMVSTIEKISRLVEQKKPELKGVLGEYKKSMDLLRQAYDKILVEDKGQLINI